MQTITLKYDAKNILIKKLLEVIVSLGGEIKTKKDSVSPEARKIAKNYSDVKAGKIKTRPISELFNEL